MPLPYTGRRGWAQILLLRLRAQQNRPTAPPPVQPGFMVVTCPANARGGLQVVVQAPDGQQLQVQIPAGVGPGGQFRVPLPPPRAPQPQAVAYAQPQMVQPQPVQYAAQPAYAPQPT